MQYLIYDSSKVNNNNNRYFLGGDLGCYNSGWGSLERILTLGIEHQIDENQTETTLEWINNLPECCCLLLATNNEITYDYIQQNHPELLI